MRELAKLLYKRGAHKVVGYSCVVVKGSGKEMQVKDVTKEYFKCKKWKDKIMGSVPEEK